MGRAPAAHSGLMCVSLYSSMSTGMCGQGRSMTLTCALESTQAPCCVACWAFGSGSLMSGLGTWTLRTNLNLEASPGKPEQSPLLLSLRLVNITVGNEDGGMTGGFQDSALQSVGS